MYREYIREAPASQGLPARQFTGFCLYYNIEAVLRLAPGFVRNPVCFRAGIGGLKYGQKKYKKIPIFLG
jgi:hypothetical protein